MAPLPRTRRRRLATALALAAISAVVPGRAAVAEPDPAKVGEWAEPVDIGHLAIHATLLHTGDVLLFSYPNHGHDDASESRAALLDLDTMTTEVLEIPYERDLFCAGHTVLADGRVFVSGGHAHTSEDRTDGLGGPETDIFDPSDNSWHSMPPLSFARWYPSNVATPDGRVYIFGGQVAKNETVATVEVFDSATELLTTAPDTAAKEVFNYPAMYLMRDGSIFKARPTRSSHSFDPATSSWSPTLARLRLSGRLTSTSVLMPGGNVMVIGGHDANGVATATAETINPLAAAPRWRYTPPMHHARAHPNAVLLPNAKVLAVGGGGPGKYGEPVRSAEMYDPRLKVWELLAEQEGGRMYHSTALLLPDGRVLSAGQNQGDYQTTVEVFSPPYLFKGERPEIVSAPHNLTYGEKFTLETPQAGQVGKASLIRPGSVTHGYNPDQRYIPLTYERRDGSLRMTVPNNPNLAPPGWYMLFIVANKVPAVAKWVHLDNAPIEPALGLNGDHTPGAPGSLGAVGYVRNVAFGSLMPLD